MEILVADDDFFSRTLLIKMLESEGHGVLIAEDGQKAWEMIRQHDIRMVITDWMMPRLDGLQLCRIIRESETSGYVFIILLTAKDSRDDIIVGLEAGADDYMSKPFSRGEMMARLKGGLRILELETSLKQAKKELEHLAITDPLTQCYNKRYLNDNLLNELKRCRRYDHSFSLMICDIDHFKKINDTYGHLAGDEILKGFADHLKSGVRKDLDWVVRYGGEEFLIILPEIRFQDAEHVGERLRKELAARTFDVGSRIIQITASFGVTGFDVLTPDEKITTETLIGAADGFLYQAKSKGRNRVKSGPL